MDDGSPPTRDSPQLQWDNVALGLCFVLFDTVLSHTLKLGVGNSLLTAAFRCVVQLTLVSYVLERVFNTNHPLAVAGIAGELCILVYGWI
jgi:ABC-type iron transport system FetAB permease component